jgi:hypothetical protein
VSQKRIAILVGFITFFIFLLSSYGLYVDFPDAETIRSFIVYGSEGDWGAGGLYTAYWEFESNFGDDGVILLNALSIVFFIFIGYKYSLLSFLSILILLPSLILLPLPNRENLFLAGLIGLYVGIFSDDNLILKVLLIGFSIFLIICAKILLAFLFLISLVIFFISIRIKINFLVLSICTLILSIFISNSSFYADMNMAYFGINGDSTQISSNLSGSGFLKIGMRFLANIFSPILHMFSQESITSSYHLYIGISSLVFTFLLVRAFLFEKKLNLNQKLSIYTIFLISAFVPFVQSRYCLPAMLIFSLPASLTNLKTSIKRTHIH